jgi:RNA polymerase sigma-70 factor (family 1)
MLDKKFDIQKPTSSNNFMNFHKTEEGMKDSFVDDELFLKKEIEQNPEKGIELLYRRYFQPLCSHAVKYVGSKSIAEDIVSEIFLRFYSNRSFENIESSYRLYLYRAVRNRSFSYLKYELNRNDSLEEKHNYELSDAERPDSISQFEEMYQDVQNAVNRLPIDRRKIYLLNRFEGKKYAEIAEELHLSVKTVEVQLYRSNKFIRSILKEKWMLSFFLLTNLNC